MKNAAEMANRGLFCPEEGCWKETLVKSGLKWSGRHKIQRYQCRSCGRTTTVPIHKAKRGRPRKVKQ